MALPSGFPPPKWTVQDVKSFSNEPQVSFVLHTFGVQEARNTVNERQ